MLPIVLASKSPRRKELLNKICDQFTIDVPKNPEIIDNKWPLKSISKHLATQKALEIYQKHPDSLIIGADTIVLIDKQILGKPKDEEDAKRMISLLSGKTHLVITGVCIIKENYLKKFSCTSKVTFKELTEQEINLYCQLKTIYDKAGAYAIQGEAKKFITKIKGDYNNIVGLPIYKLKKYLK